MQIKLKHIISLVFSLIIVFLVQYKPISSDKDRDDLAKTWANTKMAGMTLEKKVGQLFMIQAYSNQGETHQKNLLEAVNRYHIGGIAFFQGSPGKQVELTRKLQYASEIPLLVALDAEWGLGMRLDSAISFPRQFTLGAIQDNRLIYEMGKEIGSQLKEIGVHMNFAPVIDINNNPRNPIINDRSFGEGKKNVSRKGYAYMRGMQEKGILACAKHFPGHGDTDKDSHKILPTISKTREELEEMELFPFKLLFQQGVKSVMVGHLHVPSIDNRKNRPASLSDKLIQGLIREEMGFNGLILTDALGMKGVADHFKAGEIEVEAFLAGNDILTVSQSLPAAYKAVLKAVRTGKISQQRLESSVLRILVSKFEAGLFFPPDLKVKKLDKALNSGKALALKENLFRNSVTYLKGKTGALPITKANNKKIATIAVGINEEGVFQDRISSYSDAKHYFLPKNANANDVNRLNRELSEAEIVIFSFEALNKSRRKKFGISQHALSLFKQVQTKSKVYAVIFGSPYCLELFNPNDNIILAYEEDPMAKDMAAQAIFGANEIEGKLPVTVGYGFSQGSGDFVAKSKVLSYALPEHVGLSSDSLAQIAQIVETMINTGAAPGCQVIVAKNSRIIYDRTFGFHTYDKKRSVQQDDIYDLASVTKIMATTLAVMKLYENGQIDIFDKVSRYIEGDIDTSNKKDITIIEALTHHAGLKPWIPFYQGTLDTLKDNSIVPSNRFYRRIASSGFDVKVANDLFIDRTYKDTIQKLIYGSELRKNKKYKYSDLGLYLVKDVVEEVTGKTLDQYVFEQYYKPLDLPHIGFNPSNRVNLNRIVPTEDDNYYRMQKLQGYVHDMGAAMLGGVSGHAGLFSNASDLVVLMQMLINNGVYGDQRYLDQKTIYTFTTRYQRSSRRGIGFDMKELNNRKSMNMSDLAPPSTFGHLGFTGTCVFADPDNDLIYVFLSNRTYPTMQNKKFVKESYRSKIHSVIYQSLID